MYTVIKNIIIDLRINVYDDDDNENCSLIYQENRKVKKKIVKMVNLKQVIDFLFS